MWNKLFFVFIVLLACSAQAGYEIIYPESVGAIDVFTNVGGADKIASITDADDATYIRSANNSLDTQEVNMADLTVAEGADVIDSIRFVWRAAEVGTIADIRGRASIMIGTDVLNGAIQSFGLMTTYTESFTSPPGSRGTWDIVEIDSLVGRFAITTTTAGDHGRIALAYIEVFFTAEIRQVYWIESPSTLNPNNDVSIDTIKVFIPNGSPPTTRFVGMPVASDWTTAGFQVTLNVPNILETPELQVRFLRINSSGVRQDSTPYFPSTPRSVTPPSESFNVPSYNWIDGAVATDSLVLDFLWTNAGGQPDDSCWIACEASISASYVETEILYAPPPQGSGSGSATKSSAVIAGFDALCDNLEDTVEGTAYQQVDFTGGVDKIAGTQFESGDNHLLLYDASFGSFNFSRPGYFKVNFGTTVIAELAYESAAGPGKPVSSRGGGASGFYMASGTAAAADSFFMQHKADLNGNEIYTGGKCLMAVNLGNLTENTHYWYAQQNGAEGHKQDSINTSQDTLLGLTVDLSGKSGTSDYIVLASCEIWTPNASADMRVLLAIDGSVQKERVYLEFEDVQDRNSWSYARLTSLTAASHRLTIVYGPADAGTNYKQARRGRIIVIDTSAYDQVIGLSNNDFDTVKTAYSTYANHDGNSGTDLAGINFAPNQSEPVIVIANSWMQSGQFSQSAAGLMRLTNDSQAVSWSDASSHSPNSQDIADDSTRKGMVTALGFKGDSANPTAWSLQVSADTVYTVTVTPKFKYADLIIWGLTETLGAPPAAPANRRKIRLERQGLIGYEPPEQPIKLAREVLKLPECNCEE